MRSHGEPSNQPTVAHVIHGTTGLHIHLVTVTGDEFEIRLTPDMADQLSDQIAACSQRDRDGAIRGETIEDAWNRREIEQRR